MFDYPYKQNINPNYGGCKKMFEFYLKQNFIHFVNEFRNRPNDK